MFNRSSLAVVLLTIYLMASTELHSIFEIPVFFQHYHQHVQLNGTKNLYQFFIDHYVNEHANDNDHQRLPFKSDHCVHTMIAPTIPPDNRITYNVQVNADHFIPTLFLDQLTIMDFNQSIWQPPRA